MRFLIRSAHCSSHVTTELDKEESAGLHRSRVLAAVTGRGTTFLLLLCVGGGLLLCGCSKGTSKSNPNQQAATEANPQEVAAEAEAKSKSEAEQKNRAQSLNNLKQIALAFHNYHDTYKTFPSAVQIGPKGVPHSWRVTLLPYLEGAPVYDRYRQDEPWDSEHNKTLLAEMPAVLRAPDAAPDSTNTSYFGFMPSNLLDDQPQQSAAIVMGTRATRMRDIIDGTSNTILVVESKLEVPWTKPADLPFEFGQPLPTIGGIYSGGFCAAMGDASTTFIPDSFDRADLVHLIDRQDGNRVKSPAEIERELAVAEERKRQRQKLVTSGNPADRLALSRANLKQIALAFHNYHDTYKAFPAAVQTGPKNTPRSWRVTILPFLDHIELYERYQQDEPWDSPHNKTVLSKMPDVYRAPGVAANSTNSAYFGFTLSSPAESDPKALPAVAGASNTRLRDIVDGTANTILVVETKLDVPWTQPADVPYDAASPLPKLGGFHDGGFNAALCDGSSIFFPDTFDRGMLLKFIQRDDGNPVSFPAR